MLTPETVVIGNVPDIRDVNHLIELLSCMGVETKKTGPGTYEFRAGNVNLDYLRCDDYIRKSASLRGSVMILGPLLARYGKAMIPKPGGDKIGRRRLDTHFIGI